MYAVRKCFCAAPPPDAIMQLLLMLLDQTEEKDKVDQAHPNLRSTNINVQCIAIPWQQLKED